MFSEHLLLSGGWGTCREQNRYIPAVVKLVCGGQAATRDARTRGNDKAWLGGWWLGTGERGGAWRGRAQGRPGPGGDIVNTSLNEEKEGAMQVSGGVRGEGGVLGENS